AKVVKKLKKLEKNAQKVRKEIREVKAMVSDRQTEVGNININIAHIVEFLSVPPHSCIDISFDED
ncbi:conserved hypothetical protein, partial [Ricinus communis]